MFGGIWRGLVGPGWGFCRMEGRNVEIFLFYGALSEHLWMEGGVGSIEMGGASL